MALSGVYSCWQDIIYNYKKDMIMKKSLFKSFAVVAIAMIAMSFTVMGDRTCDSCGGRGSLTCPTCGGRPYFKCVKCGGSGQVEYKGSTYTCGICEGTGYNECRTCNGKGAVLCTRCFGRGTIHTND